MKPKIDEKRNGQKVVSCGQIRPILGSLDTLSGDFLKFLSCFKNRKRNRPGGGPRLPPPLPQKKN